MVDVAHPAAGSMTVTQSRTSWGVEIGRHRLSVTRTREARTLGGHGGGTHGGSRARTAIRPAWPIAVGAFASVSAFGLFVVGAIASEPSIAYHPSRYSLSLPVPVRAAKLVKAVPPRGADKARQATAVAPDLSGPRFDAADESYVVRAMQAGEFQEWTGADGQRRFLNAGPEQAEGDRRCRDLALLVRHLDGSSRTRTARRCAPARPVERTVAAPAEAASVYHPPLAAETTDLSSSSIDPRPAADPAYADAGDAAQPAMSGR